MYYMMSIHSYYAECILNGKKTVEIRRAKNNMKKGDCVAIYATRPVAQIVGFFIVDEVKYDRPCNIWKNYKKETCIKKIDFDHYSAGKDKLSAIVFSLTKQVKGKTLSEINVHIPQSYARISEECFYDLCNIIKD